jgi:hypothetical protein
MPRSAPTDDLSALAWALVAGLGMHWLITPAAHPAATTAQYVWAWIQFVGGIVLMVRIQRRQRTAASPE